MAAGSFDEKPVAPTGNKAANAWAPNTNPRRWLGLRGNRLIMGITLTATLGFLVFGYNQGVMAGIITANVFNSNFRQTMSDGPDDVHTATIQGTVTAVYEVGCFFGAMFAFFVAEPLGRRRMMWLGSAVLCIGTTIQISAVPGKHGFLQFMIGRVITGFGNGANTSTIPSWVAECSKAHNRGLLTCVEASMVAVGTCIAYWIDFGLRRDGSQPCFYVPNSVSWRVPIALQIVFVAGLSLGVYLLPESPRWLFVHGHYDAASQIVADLNDQELEDDDTQRQIRIIVEGINASAGAAAGVTMKELFVGGKKQHFRRMAVGASSQIFQQLGGCNAVIYYSTVLFEQNLGFTGRMPLILGGVLSTVYGLSALTSFLYVERAGRRNMFLIGSFGQCVAMFIIFGCLLPDTASASNGAAFGLFLYIVFFATTWLPLPWLYPAELNPLRIRTKANAVSTMSNWLFNFLVVQVLPTMTASIHAYTFLIFGVANALFIPVIYLFYPETKGRTLEAIDLIFAKAFQEKERPVHVARAMPDLTDAQVEAELDAADIHGTGRRGDVESEGSTARGSPRGGTGGFDSELKADRAADQNPMLKS